MNNESPTFNAQIAPRSSLVVLSREEITRLRDLMDEFQGAFNDADVVYAAPVYAAGEAPIAGVTSDELVAGLKRRGHRAAATIAGFVRKVTRHGVLVYISGARPAVRRVLLTHHIRPPAVRFKRNLDDTIVAARRAPRAGEGSHPV